MAIPYRTAKFKSANIFAMAIWGPTAKFNSHQYFQLCSILEYIYHIFIHYDAFTGITRPFPSLKNGFVHSTSLLCPPSLPHT